MKAGAHHISLSAVVSCFYGRYRGGAIIVAENGQPAKIAYCLISMILALTIFSCGGQVDITILSPALQSIEITPSNVSIAKGYAHQFTATGTFSDKSTQDITTSVVWRSSGTGVVTISNAAGSNGLAAAVGSGSTTITAELGGVSGSTTCNVANAVLLSIVVTPAAPNIKAGSGQQFTATGNFSDKSTQVITTVVTWTSSSTGVVAFSNIPGSNGLASAVGSGSATITAASGGVSGATTCTVTEPAAATVDLWQTFDFDQLTVANLDANDHSNEGTWVIDNSGEASMSASGERAAPAAFNGQRDAGGYGLTYEYLSGDLPQHGCAGYYFASNKSAFSAGFWLYVPDEVGVYGEHDVFTINPLNASEGTYLKLGDTWTGTDMRLMVFQYNNGGYSNTTLFLYPYNRWYWITIGYTQSGDVKVSAYDDSLKFVGEVVHQNKSINAPINNVWIGSLIGPSEETMHKVLYWDDLVLDWTNAQYPLGVQ